MYIKLRLVDSNDTSIRYECSSINEKIYEIKENSRKLLNISEDYKIRLFLNGKELKDDITLLEYGIKINDIIHLFKQKMVLESDINKSSNANESKSNNTDNDVYDDEESLNKFNYKTDHKELFEDDYYRVNEYIDAIHPEIGAWFEAIIVRIINNNNNNDNNNENEYQIRFLKSSLALDLHLCKLNQIRPPSYIKIPLRNVLQDDIILVNHNLNNECEPGYWYDYKVTHVNCKKKYLRGIIIIGEIRIEAVLRFTNELYRIEKNCLRNARTEEIQSIISQGCPKKRLTSYDCMFCFDSLNIPCVECSCCVCGSKIYPSLQLICDECNRFYHIWCLPNPLNKLPPLNQDWYCHICKNEDKLLIEKREQEILEERRKKCYKSRRKRKKDDNEDNDETNSSKKIKTSYNSKWGRGISCIGRSKISETKNHFGPIPGIEVGMCWRFRFQVSEVGLHTPLVAGIHGKENLGAYSIVFCCSYEDDIDLGDEIYYTGSGGRESGTKCRVGGIQVKDQEMKRCNKALAMNCAAQFNDKGADAGKNWKNGKPVRVLRSGNGRKSRTKSKYLPSIGVRYDGIYKVVKYWPETRKGLVVWRYLLRRDDENPSPWTKAGKERKRKLRQTVIIPDGFIEKKKGKEEKIMKEKKNYFHLEEDVKKLIEEDKKNKNIWQQLMEMLPIEKSLFLSKVEECFKCACCLDIAYEPVTTFCSHNICKVCLEHSLASSVNTCPICRNDLVVKSNKPKVNKLLHKILEIIVPKYTKKE